MEVIQERPGGRLKRKLLDCKRKAAKKGWRDPRNTQQWKEKSVSYTHLTLPTSG